MWTLFDKYLFRNLALSTFLICLVLTIIIMLVQSIRYLELVMGSGASTLSFLSLMGLSIPRFIEAVLPISIMVSVLFFYNKVIIDSEVVIMRSAGASPLCLARPAVTLAGVLMIGMFVLSAWIAPTSLAKIQVLRQEIKSQYASLLFREGIFNSVGSGLTAYIKNRKGDGELEGLMVHYARKDKPNENPYTIVAKRGVLLADGDKQKIIVYDGTRHEMDVETQRLSRLDFEQYTIDIPEAKGNISKRWKEPDERTLFELFQRKNLNKEDRTHIAEFTSEANRRLTLPLLLLAFTLISLCFLLLGSLDRRGLGRRIAFASLSIIALQGLYLTFFNLAKNTLWANIAMYLVPALCSAFCFYLLSPASDTFRKDVNTRVSNILQKG